MLSAQDIAEWIWGFRAANSAAKREVSMDTKKLYDEFMITSMVAGFDPVECFWRSGNRAIFGGFKP